ncbi:NosD domain-containing protein, partial [uncultured Microbulbifer sp.]|uniref:NosD domain-containing protein n=1 Tax=uncultured Microbulbifer sp. TaxID=348147 RepID=UPI00262A57D8
PQIAGNTIRGSQNGIYVYRNSAPQISGGNVIAGNVYGIYAYGHSSDVAQNPVPVVTGNSLYDNSSYNYYTRYFADAALTTLDATGNWWGSTDAGQIAQKIYDWTDGQGTYPIVDYRHFLDGPDGNQAYTGEALFGYFTEDTNLPEDNYLVLGRVEVAAGTTLSIGSGTELQFAGNYPLLVKGALTAQGNEASPIVFKPTAEACDGINTRRKDWPGITVVAGATATIEYAEVHCANIGIYFNGGDGSIRNSQLLNNYSGIDARAASVEAVIAPQISGNTIRGSKNGISAYRNSAPQISGGNVITGNTHGIYAEG